MRVPNVQRYPEDRNHPLLNPDSDDVLDLLLLEDNDIDATVFLGAAARSSRKLNVRRAESIAEFKVALTEKAPDLICADHLLPDGSAMQALSLRNVQSPFAPFIVITGAGEEEVAVDYMRQGAADYLSKRRLDQFPLSLENVLNAYRDRALRTIAEKEKEKLNGELLALIQHVEGERDEEKKSLSRDIHDQLGQELTALKLGLFWIERHLKKEEGMEPLLDKVSDLIELNTSIIHQVRNIARSLRPVVLDQVGLTAGLETLIVEFNRREKTFCGLNVRELPDLTDGMRTDIFRIVQEALTNIARHANATLAYVNLYHEGDHLAIEIGDDGQGMDVTSHPTSSKLSGLGMMGMRERVRNHKGMYTVQSDLLRGTTINIELPLPKST